jgi:hypothetical protein
MRVHTVLDKRAMAGRLFYLLERHTLADVLEGESSGPTADCPRGATVKPAESSVQRAAHDSRSRRIAFERSELRAAFHNLASNCAPS